MKSPKIALVHDYLKEYGGAERVLLVLHEMFPEAPIYTIFSTSGSPAAKEFKRAKIVQSWFCWIPFCDKLISPLRFLVPFIWGSFNFDEYDLIISSASWAITKGFSNGKNREICYCHTPPRFLYGYETSRNWKAKWWVRVYATIVNHFMRLYDFERSQKVTQFVANSREVQKRIEKFYRRESVVVNPPVDISKIKEQNVKNKRGEYFLTGGRLVLQKNFDLIIKACNKSKTNLKIYGTGPEEEKLKSLAGPTIEFIGLADEELKAELFSGCKAFIVAAMDEDFGITPVEAMAFGKPVIAYAGGGYLETIVEGETGTFFEIMDINELSLAMKRIDKMNIKVEDCQRQAEKFSKEKFVNSMNRLINNV